ncbi:hypothetical protein Kisp01_71690 [Kineosporia sp. NBRC 101677]|nr:hypothetical protein Kisp01_71690 [Kineosporia sp. NBRC 101677]
MVLLAVVLADAQLGSGADARTSVRGPEPLRDSLALGSGLIQGALCPPKRSGCGAGRHAAASAAREASGWDIGRLRGPLSCDPAGLMNHARALRPPSVPEGDAARGLAATDRVLGRAWAERPGKAERG